jgi:hypothetical protein
MDNILNERKKEICYCQVKIKFCFAIKNKSSNLYMKKEGGFFENISSGAYILCFSIDKVQLFPRKQ